ncbi:hypothetical protein ABPG75_011751 [Micractinium tetrahymenae]
MASVQGAGPAMPALDTLPPALPSAAPPTVLDLPTAVKLHIFSHLTAAKLAACMATCRAWRQSAATPELWQGACKRRWRSGATTGQLAGLARQGRWLEVHRLRRQADAPALALVVGLQQPEGRRGAAAQHARLADLLK